MSKIREAYTALTPSSPRPQVSAALQSIIDAPPLTIDDANRKELVQTIINDLKFLTKGSSSSSKSRLTSKDSAEALAALKSLGKNPAGSETIATAANLSAILAISEHLKDDIDASNEALRCIANALLLVETARKTFIKKEVGGGETMVEYLEKTTSPDRVFIVCRIMFFLTLSTTAEAYLRSLVESKPQGHHSNIVDIIATKLDTLLTSILSSEKMAREAMSEVLKLGWNLVTYYPRVTDPSDGERMVMHDAWSDRLDGFITPLLRTFNFMPTSHPAPFTSPMTHLIHVLVSIPVTSSNKSKWFPPLSNTSSPVTASKLISPVGSPSTSSPPVSRSGSPPAAPSKESKESKPSTFDRALSKLTVRKSSSRTSTLAHNADTLLRAYDILDVTLSHYLPDTIDPDDPSVQQRCTRETDQAFDELLPPLVLFIKNMCAADETVRKRLREWVLPDDLDRSSPLEGRADFLGRCLRLLGCINHAHTKISVGEMLYAICDSDAAALAAYVGYGNVAGFLFQKGIMGAPGAPSSSSVGAPSATADGVPINPITGVAQTQQPLGPEMSDEEKEREAEKLFVLFDRLERMGAIPPSQNPVRKAIAEGKGPAY
ncbi:guanine nucleotide exchange factor [Cytidiella melzeri]|nr:guanine nucleotide exchange factor [Cytidiella melzeri]